MNGLKYKLIILVAGFSLLAGGLGMGSAYALTPDGGSGGSTGSGKSVAADPQSCGAPDQKVETAIDLGCRHQGNPILDMMFAILRLLSDGVGLVLVGSIIIGGIQYTMSAGDPQGTAKAIGRIRATLFALLLYIFAYPLLNYLLPAGFF